MASGDVAARLTKVRAFNCNVFDGVDDFIESADISANDGSLTDESFTVSGWVLIKQDEVNAVPIEFRTTSGTNVTAFKISRNSANLLIAQIVTQAGGTVGTGTKAYSVGVWHHVLATKTPTEMYFYVDGSASTAGNTSGSSDYRILGNIRLARNTSSSVYANCAVKDVKVWNRVLTAAEIAADYAGSGPTNGLLYFVKLGGDLTDYGSRGTTFTNTGSVASVVDDALAAAVKAQRVASTDKWMIYRGSGGQVGTVNIE